MRRAVSAGWCVAAIVAVAGCHRHAPDPEVRHAWVRLPAVPGQPAAAYFEVIGGAGDASADVLTGIANASAQRIEMHRSMTGMGGMSSMAPLARVAIPRHGYVRFAPGEKHAMLYGLAPGVLPGTSLPLRFTFASGKTANAAAKVIAAGDDAPAF